MDQNLQFESSEYRFLKRPKILSDLSVNSQQSSLSKNHEDYYFIKGTSEQKFRVYKRSLNDCHRQMTLFKWRNETYKPIVKVLYVQMQQNYCLKEGQDFKSIIYTQHLAYRFTDMVNLSLAQTLYLLRKTINGFEAILSVLGYVSIDPNCCGITSKGECKVWINNNFGQNKEGKLPKLQQERQIVSQILKIIKRCSSKECTSFFSYLMKCVLSFDRLKFKTILQVIGQYCLKNQIYLPLYLNYQKQAEGFLKENNTNKNLESTGSKLIKRYSNFSHKSEYLGSEISQKSSYCSELKGSQRVSLAGRISIQSKAQDFKHSVPCLSRKKYSFAENTCLQSTHSSDLSVVKKTRPSFNQLGERPKCLDTLSSFARARHVSIGGSELTKNIAMSLGNDLASLSSILMNITEGKDQANQTLNSSSSIESSFNDLKMPFKRQSSRAKNIICHQFSINLIDQIRNDSPKDRLKIFHVETNKSHCETGNMTPRLGLQTVGNKHKRSPTETSFGSEGLQQLNMCPRFNVQPERQRFFNERYLNSDVSLKKTYHKPSFLSKQVQSATCFQPTQDCYANKQNRSIVFQKLEQEKRLSKKRRNSRLLRQQLEEQQEAKLFALQQDYVLSVNKWKRVVSTLTEVSENTNLQHSISVEILGGQQKERSPVMLSMLDQLGGELTQSIIPQ